jgi:anti-anti-sigma factor
MFERRAGYRPVYADKHLVVTRTDDPAGLRFAGEIDVSNSAAVGESVRGACCGEENAHLDLANLSFCDISGIRALVDAAQELDAGRTLLLHGLPEQLQTVMRVTGWSDLPSLSLCRCGAVR